MANKIKSLELDEKKTFIQREWFSLVVIFILVVVGNKVSSVFTLSLATIFILFCVLKSDISDAFYWSLFLVPNIRMLDAIGVSFIVNVIMALPLIVYFFRMGIKKIPTVALLGSMSLLAIELFHDMVLCGFENIVLITGWGLNVFLCILVTVNSKIGISKNDVFSALSTGIIMSAVMYISAGFISISDIIKSVNSGTRFAAFADDPNYYSIYICLTLACVLNVTGKKIYRFCVLCLLIGIGLLTASKMCILVMVAELVIFFFQVFNNDIDSKKNRKFIILTTIGLLLILLILKNYVWIFIENFIRRLGQAKYAGLNLESLTTGRSRIFLEYIKILSTNWKCLLFGYGFSYNLYLGISTGHVAHNIYLDLALSWGIIGTVIFIFILGKWISCYKSSRRIQKITTINKFPLFVLLVTFLALSCLSASMFPFVIAVAIIQWLPNSIRN